MTDKFFSAGKIFQYYLPVSLTFFTFVTIERTVEGTDGGYDRLYGLPLPWISSVFAFTHHYDVYLVPMAINLLFCFGLAILIFAVLSKLGLKLKTHWVVQFFGILLSLFYAFLFYVLVFESSFYFLNDVEYKTISMKLIINL
jgi:hypothetical protein